MASVVLLGGSSTAQAAGTVIFKKNNTTAITTAGSFSTTSGGATDAATPGTGTGSFTGSTGSTTPNPNALILKWDGTVLGANSVSSASAAIDGIIIANPDGLVTIGISGSNTLTLGASGIDMSSADLKDLTINGGTLRLGPGINTGVNQSWTVAGSRTLTVNSALNGSQGGTSTLTLAGAGLININGAISQSGAAKMTLTGATVTLAGTSNTSSGATTITSGILNIGSGGTGGFLGSGAVANSGTINFNHSDALSVGNAITGTGIIAMSGGNSLTLTGVNTAGTVNSAALLAHSGTTVIDTGGSLTTAISSYSSIGITAGETATATIQGSGSWLANGDVNVGDTGSTTVAATGTLNITSGSASALTLGTAGGFYVGSGFTAGTLATGTVNQSNGTVIANNTTAGTFVLGGRTSIGGTGTYNLTGGFLTTKGLAYVGGQGTGTLNLSTAGSYFANLGVLLGNGASANGTVNLDAGGSLTTTSITKGSGTGTFNFNGGTLATGSTTATALMTGLTAANVRNGGAIIDTGTANATIGQTLIHSTISGDNATDGGLTKLGSGTLTLGASNSYTGATTITNGQITMGANDSLGSGAAKLNGGTLRFNSGGALANNVQLTAAISAISQNSSDTFNGTISSSGSGLTGTLNLAYSGNLTFSLGNSTTGLTDFHGTLALTPQSGVTTIGNLRYTNVAIIGTGTDTTFDLGNNGGYINSSLGNSPSLTFKLGALVGGTNSALKGSSASVNRMDTYEIGAKNLSTEFAGVIQNGTGATAVQIAVTKVGTGSLKLSGNSLYTGGTTVTAGTLLANGAGALGSGTTNINGGVLAGTGSTGGAVNVNSGGSISAGTGAAAPVGGVTSDVVGTMTSGAQSWKAGGAYRLKFAAVTNDLLQMSTLNLSTLTNASAATKFRIVLLNAAANAFNTTTGGVYTIASTTGGVSSITRPSGYTTDLTDLFYLDASNIGIADNTGFSVTLASTASGYDVNLSYAAAPEPTTAALFGLGACSLFGRRRRAIRKCLN